MFSVVIPTYNRAELLRRACDSVLTQRWRDLELIVVDDGSIDDTAAVVDALADERVRYSRCEHRGVSATRNEGARLARGRYLLFLDSDDVALPSWLEQFDQAFSKTNPDLAVCGIEAVGTDGVIDWRWSPGAGPVDPSELAAHFRAGQVALRRELFLASGGFTPELRFGESTELALRLLFETTPPPVTAMIPEVLVRVRPPGIDEDYTRFPDRSRRLRARTPPGMPATDSRSCGPRTTPSSAPTRPASVGWARPGDTSPPPWWPIRAGSTPRGWR